MKVTLGRTGIISDKNAFGALPIQRVSTEYAGKLLCKAYDAGITFFDTAQAYSDSEVKIGLALSHVRDKIHIATKTGAQDTDTFWTHLHGSLKNLKTDYIDIYQFHTPSFCPKPDDGTGLYEAMLEAKKQGKIRFISITNHRPDVAKEAVESGLYDTLQFPFCYLASQNDIDLVNLCKEKNVGFIAMKGLSGGLINNSAAAYAWLAQFDNVLPIWGVQKETELDEFISYIKKPPEYSGELKKVIDNDRHELIGSFCRACGYCLPTCPVDIQINQVARMSQLIRRAPSAGWLSEGSQAMMMKGGDCIDCGQCTAHCPYELDTPRLIRENLADYKKILSGEISVANEN